MNYALSLLKEIIKKRKLVWDLGKADFRKRFVGSYFGIVWMFIQPVVTIVIYAVIFGIGFKSPPPVPGVSYVIWLVPGIVPWFFFGEALNGITGCLQEYSYLVKKVVFKVEILPMIKLISCLLVHGFFVLIMMIMYLVAGRMPMLSWIQVIYYALRRPCWHWDLVFYILCNVFFRICPRSVWYLPSVRYLDGSDHVS